MGAYTSSGWVLRMTQARDLTPALGEPSGELWKDSSAEPQPEAAKSEPGHEGGGTVCFKAPQRFIAL